MKNKWKYVKIIKGEKRPVGNNWQTNPLEYKDVDQTKYGIGLLLGEPSGGVVSIDFDGEKANDFYIQHIGDIDKLVSCDTPSWCSGKPGRFQIAFSVPKEYWDQLKMKKITLEDKQGFECRWTGGQSVLPPSPHPETAGYTWINNTTNLAEIPNELLTWWLKECEVKPPVEYKVEYKVDYDDAEIEALLTKIKTNNPTLSFDHWSKLTWGLASKVGNAEAIALMMKFYPEQKSNEYINLFKSYNPSTSPTFGTVVFMSEGDNHAKVNEEDLLKQKLTEMKTTTSTLHKQIDIMPTLAVLPTVIQELIVSLKEGAGFSERMSLTTALAVINFSTQRLYNVDPVKFSPRPLTEFFIALQARSGGKSSIYELLLTSVNEDKLDKKIIYDNAMVDYITLNAIYKNELKKIKDGDSHPNKPLKPSHYDPFVESPTVNGLINHLFSCSNAGIFSTEGAKFLNSYDTRSKESTTTLITSLSNLWSGEELKKDTGIEKIRLPNRRCNMLLMIQKSMASSLFSDSNEEQGLSSRMLIVDESTWVRKDESKANDILSTQMKQNLTKFHKKIKRLMDKPIKTSRFDPNELILETITFHETTNAARREYFNYVNKRVNNNSNGVAEGFLGKIYEHACRLAGMLAAFREPIIKKKDAENTKINNLFALQKELSVVEIPQIMPEDWEAGIMLAEFFYAERINMITPLDDTHPMNAASESLIEWLNKKYKKNDSFTKQNLSQAGPNKYRKLSKDDRNKILFWLIEEGVLVKKNRLLMLM